VDEKDGWKGSLEPLTHWRWDPRPEGTDALLHLIKHEPHAARELLDSDESYLDALAYLISYPHPSVQERVVGFIETCPRIAFKDRLPLLLMPLIALRDDDAWASAIDALKRSYEEKPELSVGLLINELEHSRRVLEREEDDPPKVERMRERLRSRALGAITHLAKCGIDISPVIPMIMDHAEAKMESGSNYDRGSMMVLRAALARPESAAEAYEGTIRLLELGNPWFLRHMIEEDLNQTQLRRGGIGTYFLMSRILPRADKENRWRLFDKLGKALEKDWPAENDPVYRGMDHVERTPGLLRGLESAISDRHYRTRSEAQKAACQYMLKGTGHRRVARALIKRIHLSNGVEDSKILNALGQYLEKHGPWPEAVPAILRAMRLIEGRQEDWRITTMARMLIRIETSKPQRRVARRRVLKRFFDGSGRTSEVPGTEGSLLAALCKDGLELDSLIKKLIDQLGKGDAGIVMRILSDKRIGERLCGHSCSSEKALEGILGIVAGSEDMELVRGALRTLASLGSGVRFEEVRHAIEGRASELAGDAPKGYLAFAFAMSGRDEDALRFLLCEGEDARCMDVDSEDFSGKAEAHIGRVFELSQREGLAERCASALIRLGGRWTYLPDEMRAGRRIECLKGMASDQRRAAVLKAMETELSDEDVMRKVGALRTLRQLVERGLDVTPLGVCLSGEKMCQGHLTGPMAFTIMVESMRKVREGEWGKGLPLLVLSHPCFEVSAVIGTRGLGKSGRGIDALRGHEDPVIALRASKLIEADPDWKGARQVIQGIGSANVMDSLRRLTQHESSCPGCVDLQRAMGAMRKAIADGGDSFDEQKLSDIAENFRRLSKACADGKSRLCMDGIMLEAKIGRPKDAGGFRSDCAEAPIRPRGSSRPRAYRRG